MDFIQIDSTSSACRNFNNLLTYNEMLRNIQHVTLINLTLYDNIFSLTEALLKPHMH